LLDVLCLKVVEADFVYEGVEGGRFEREDGFEVEALRGVSCDVVVRVRNEVPLACSPAFLALRGL
jgi:hypothetical protein